MTALTPEAARSAAEWLSAEHHATDSARELRAEADRLETASRTPEQVAQKAWDWAEDSGLPMGSCWKAVTAAVIAHHVGPDRVVVDREDLATGLRYLEGHGATGPAVRNLREALS